jgi:hypothetical protein
VSAAKVCQKTCQIGQKIEKMANQRLSALWLEMEVTGRTRMAETATRVHGTPRSRALL